MIILINFLPILLFIVIFFGAGMYFSWYQVENAFYQLPPTSAIIPSLILAWMLNNSNSNDKTKYFLAGASHHDIITMCIIFLLAGALSAVTGSIGCVESTVNLAITLIPKNMLLIGIFLTSALISSSIGTSLATVAAMGSIITELAARGSFAIELGAATLIGGAMFGDNLSIISDTTIAAVSSQEANMQKKLKLNAFIATIASIITISLLMTNNTESVDIANDRSYSFLLVSPYLFLIITAISGANVFIVLIISLIYAGAIGIIFNGYNLISFAKDISKGFAGMQEIMLLSILTGGLSGLSNKNSGQLAKEIFAILPKKSGKKVAELLIAATVSIFDILLANNTIAIIFSGEMAKETAKKYGIQPHESAAWLDIFSCVFQGIIPYGAQVLLISAIAGISPLLVIGKVYYCYILGLVAIIYILFRK